MSDAPPNPQPPLLALRDRRLLRNSASSTTVSSLQDQSMPWTASAALRQTSNPVVGSPLQQSFPAYPNTSSAPNTPQMQDTPSRPAREQHGRRRGDTRSSSVPSIVRQPSGSQHMVHGTRGPSRTQPSSHTTTPYRHSPTNSGTGGPVKPNRNSVKHLTCYWWHKTSRCRRTDEECLYAHWDTGRYTDPPKQVNPGEPAKAGKSLQRALQKKEEDERRGAHLMQALTHVQGSSTDVSSREVTPPNGLNSQAYGSSTTPSPVAVGPFEEFKYKLENICAQAEAGIRRDWVQSEAVEALQMANRQLQEENDFLKTERLQLLADIDELGAYHRSLLAERQVLRDTIMRMQYPYGPLTSPWGAVRPGAHQPDNNNNNDNSGAPSEIQSDEVESMLKTLGPEF
ncbi:hypothetical protein EDD37DRAFT_651467 [Exophiala viscosa]|uniref:C3H1-type domain-containing protein n=1 Tax=Exophiala viscosa TaxID=2486360 RepID=A0AAN6DSQ2_9EURO|nr:hypothetical protein EDD36DRAFT_465699 [Exophiala viscosa]KAI1623294.1 hypothetical protein EDD37DRAFT_651467 [Exophiala viscosa]